MTSVRSRLTLVVATALLASGCTFDGIYDLPLPGNEVDQDDGFLVSAEFADALNVVPRSAVMVGDVPIGQVEEVTRVGWHARVKMRIRQDVKLPDNAEALIRQTSLLGEKYVALSPPADRQETGGIAASTGRLGPGDVIPMERTGRNPEVEEVLGALSLLLSGGGVGQLQTITQELNEMMEGRTGRIRGVLQRLNELVGALNVQRDDIVNALDSINGLSKTLIAEKKTIGKALDAAAPAIKVLRRQHDELVDMLGELEELGEVGTRVINRTKDDLIAELRHIEPVLRALNKTAAEPSSAPNCPGCGSLVPGLVAAAGYPFPVDAGDVIHGDFANVVFRMQIKLIPVSEGGLLPTTLDDLVTLCRSTPLAPICAPGGEAVDQLCSVLSTLPLCAQSGALAPGQTPQGSAPPSSPNTPDLLKPPSSGGGGGSGGSPLDRFFGGLLGGGGSP